MIYICATEDRRATVTGNPNINGIDYLEVVAAGAISAGNPAQPALLVHCLNPLASTPTKENVLIAGGSSITGITVSSATWASDDPTFSSLPDAANVLVVWTNKAGDSSMYELRLVDSASTAGANSFEVAEGLAGFDPQLASVCFSFPIPNGPEFDCASQQPSCPGPTVVLPPINYLAKDYGSFRTVMLDRLSQLLPTWTGTSEADLGVTMAELVAYVADQMSYRQDAIATEAYLQTARSRISLRRLALLMGYYVHDGCNARAWIQLLVQAAVGTPVFLDKALARFYTSVPGMATSLAVGSGNEEAALNSGVVVFEAMCDALLYPEHNQMQFYTWGESNCCLPMGATEATLVGPLPNLQPGDVLIFQEVIGPQTGNPADADVRHRCAVRLTKVASLADPLFDVNGNTITTSGQTGAPIVEIGWAADDALPFPVCISSTYVDSNEDVQTANNVSLAFGNVVPADHGLSLTNIGLDTVPAPTIQIPPGPLVDPSTPVKPAYLPVRYEPQVPDSPLTEAVPLVSVVLPGVGNPIAASPILFGASSDVSLQDSAGFTALTLLVTNPAGWPSCFGIVVQANAANPSNIDLSVVFNPSDGAAGLNQHIVVESFTDLSLSSSDTNYALTQINGVSELIQLSEPSTPGSPTSGFSLAPTMLTNTGTVNLQDSGSSPVTYLVAQPSDSAPWPALFGVTVPAAGFTLNVVFAPPSGGLGVVLPVVVEQFPNLTLAGSAAQINGASEFVTVVGYASAVDPTLSASDIMTFDPSLGVAAITLEGEFDSTTTTWTAMPDLLESSGSAPAFVVEVESNCVASLRFGDNTNGLMPPQTTSFAANYRIGNGTAGNVGADSLTQRGGCDPRIYGCRNPLPATGGTDPETDDQIRRRASQAFMTQERAVTMQDYEAIVESNSHVQNAIATPRWTGSWNTVFLAVEPTTGGKLASGLRHILYESVDCRRMAGQDFQLSSPDYVPLEIELLVSVNPSYFQSNVQLSLSQVLGNQALPNGQLGLFYPGNFTFGQSVYLSPVYAAARSVPGVTSVIATKFQVQGQDPGQYLATGEIQLGPFQIALMDNDPRNPSNGVLTLVMEGGK